MINEKIKYSLDDLTLIPAAISQISSRSECEVFDENGMLPLFTAPMYSVVDEKNIDLYVSNNIYGILPRGSSGKMSDKSFRAYGLDEFIEVFLKNDVSGKQSVLIDIANGHMYKLSRTVLQAKEKYGDELVLMVGNIAHPETFEQLAFYGADYVRCGIGGGSVCTTSANASVHYPMGSLLDECRKLKTQRGIKAKIVADGGFRNFDDIIKALGLGADYVMCGSIFNKALESSGKTFFVEEKNGILQCCEVNQYEVGIKNGFKNGAEYQKEYYGMSTKRAQREMGHEFLKTAEGIAKRNRVEYTLGQWRENFIHYLTTAMSYTGKKTLQDFIGKVDLAVMTPSARMAYKK